MKRLTFVGDSVERIRAFPVGARKEAGVQLHRVQLGLDPYDWKPMATIGAGVREISIRDDTGAFRILYVVRTEDAVYVLHAFQKTEQMARRDIELAAERLKKIEARR